jgi:hypothetical protein
VLWLGKVVCEKCGREKWLETTMSNSRPKHVCFFSKKCPHSKAFLEELARTPYTREFQFICVDPSPQRPKLPTWLKVVPTLLIDGESDPLTEEKVFNWLSLRRIQAPASGAVRQQSQYEPPRPEVSTKQNSVYSPPVYDAAPPRAGATLAEPIQTRSSPNQASLQVTPQSSDVEPSAYHTAEMAGTGKWSDAYSFIEDQFSIEKGVGTSRIERNFTVLDGMSFSAGGNTVQSAPAEKVSEKAQALNSAVEAFRKARDSDLPAPIARR